MKKFIFVLMGIVLCSFLFGCHSLETKPIDSTMELESTVLDTHTGSLIFNPWVSTNHHFPLTSDQGTQAKPYNIHYKTISPNVPIPRPSHQISITISAVGDCTLGTDETFSYTEPYYTFDEIFEAVDGRYRYFFENVYDIFSSDDLTIANLETTLTDATDKADKKYRFKGPMDYVNILTEGSIEAVNLANNHSLDYLKKGFQDTKESLERASVYYFEESNSTYYDVKGVRIGLIGLRGWFANDTTKSLIDQEIDELKELGADYIVISFHWGIDRQYYPYDVQTELAYHSIDSGADLVLGHHPHVLQGIETYNDRQIVYSLGNFCFGGNHDPEDYDTMIYQQHLTFELDEKGSLKLSLSDYSTIPCSISSITEYNDFRPTPLTGEDKKALQQKIDDLSNF